MSYQTPKQRRRPSVVGHLGPSGVFPPFRRHGFRSFQGLGALGFDRLPTTLISSRQFVTSLHPVRGLPPGTAAQAPAEIKAALERAGLSSVEGGWAEGGRIWLRYYVPGFGQSPSGSWGDASYRRSQVRSALARAARALGPNVTIGLPDGSSVPADRRPAQSEAAPTEADRQAMEPAASGGFSAQVMSVRDLQNLLLRKGFSVGPTGADGLWGRNTAAAYQRALGGADPAVQVSADKREVTVWESHLQHLRALPDNPAPTERRTAPRRAPTMPPQDMFPDEGGGIPDWLPWVIAAGGIAAIGGYFVWSGQREGARVRRRRTSRATA